MTTSKKMTITVVSLIVAIVMIIATTIIVLVAGIQSGTAKISVKYKAEDVKVTISATCYIGQDSYKFNTDIDGESGEDSVTLSNLVKEAQLYQPNSVDGLDITKENSFAIFEYVFQNETSKENNKQIDINIDLPVYPGYNQDSSVDVSNQTKNVTIEFAVTDTQVVDFSELSLSDSLSTVELLAGDNVGAKKYVYVKVSISNLMYEAYFKGNFEWNLTRIGL